MTNIGQVSVVIPAYNVEKFLPDCLNSLLNQTYKNWRAIIVDDGSLDGTLKIANEYSLKDERIMVISKENGGVSEARNKALDMVRGQYLFYLDSDDFIHPQTFEIMVYEIEKHNASFVSMLRETVSEDAKISEFQKISKENMEEIIVDDCFMTFLKDRGVAGGVVWNKLYRFSEIKDVRFYKELRYEDDYTYLLFALIKMKKQVCLKEKLIFWRSNPTSLTRSVNFLNYYKSVLARIRIVSSDLIKSGKLSKEGHWLLSRDMADDCFRMCVRKLLRKNKDKNIKEIVRGSLSEFVENKTIDLSYLPHYKRVCFNLFIKKYDFLAKILVIFT